MKKITLIILGILYACISVTQEINKYFTIGGISDLSDMNSREQENPFLVNIYTIEYNGQNIPIQLAYNTSGINAIDEPTEVGLSWRLDLGYSIHRTVNGLPDESQPCPPQFLPDQEGVSIEYELYGRYDNVSGVIDWGGWLRRRDIDLSGLLHESDIPSTQPSKTTLNTLLIHNVFDVKPDEFTLMLQGKSWDYFFLENGEIRFLDKPSFILYSNLLDEEEPVKFSVTDDKGITYSFIEGVVKTTPWTRSDYEPFDVNGQTRDPWIPDYSSEFYISSIEYPNGETITFQYQTDTRAKLLSSKSISTQDWFPAGGYNNSAKCVVENRLILQSIVTPNETIQFFYNNYTDPIYLSYSQNYQVNTGTQHKLSEIVVRDNNLNEVKRYQFSYDTYYGGKTRLRSISNVSGEESIMLREFDYDGQMDNATPGINSQDCFGYFNNNTQNHLFPYTPTNMTPANRKPYLQKAVSGILNKVTFSNGGFVEIDYQLKAVEFNINNTTGTFYGGGLLPKQYSYFDNNQSFLYSKTYTYSGLRGIFVDIDALSGFVESGNVLQAWVYNNYDIYKNNSDKFNPIFEYDDLDTYMRRKGSFFQVVVVKVEGNNQESNGEIRYNYEPSMNRFGFEPKLTQERYYKDGETTPFRQITYSYDDNYTYSNSLFFVEHDKTTYNFILHPTYRYRQIYNIRTAPRRFFYNINEKLSQKQVIEYVSGNQLQTTVDYYYDFKGFLYREVINNSDGVSVMKRTTYPHTYPAHNEICGPAEDDMTNALKRMREKNMLNYPVEIETSRDGQITGGHISLYKNVGNTVVIDKQYELGINQTIDHSTFTNSYIHQELVSSTLCNRWFGMDERYYLTTINDNFDSKGNITQYHNDNDIKICNLWGYDQTLIIARIENATYTEVMSALSPVTYTQLQNKTDVELRAIFAGLRTALPNAMITSFTYKPLVGISSETNPAGQTTYYEYDSFGRLQYKKNNAGEYLEKLEYHFENQ